MSLPTQLAVEILVVVCFAIGIPLVTVRYNRARSREPSDREKRSLFFVMAGAGFVSSVVVDNPWGLFNDAFVAFRPFTSGTGIGLCILVLYYIRVYGWVGSDGEDDETVDRVATE